MADDAFWKNQYEKAGNSWGAWRLTADELLMAARLLHRLYWEALPRRVRGGKAMHPNIRLGGPSRLLQAAALEALLKA